MPTNLYLEVAKLLRDAGCTFVRQGKGDHEIWESPITKRRFTLPRKLQKTHTANGALKDAGLPKRY